MRKLNEYTREKLNDKKWLELQYRFFKKTTAEIGKQLGCCPQTVQKALHKHDITILYTAHRKENININEKWVKTQYYHLKRSRGQIARDLGVSPVRILTVLLKNTNNNKPTEIITNQGCEPT